MNACVTKYQVRFVRSTRAQKETLKKAPKLNGALGKNEAAQSAYFSLFSPSRHR